MIHCTEEYESVALCIKVYVAQWITSTCCIFSVTICRWRAPNNRYATYCLLARLRFPFVISYFVDKLFGNEHGIRVVANQDSFYTVFDPGYLKLGELRSDVSFTPPSINIYPKRFISRLYLLPLVRNNYIITGVEILFTKRRQASLP